MRVGATNENLALVAALATGAAEALELELEPSISLRTIAVEAAGNVITHAYPDDGPGPLEVEISGDAPASSNGGGREVKVTVQDEGIGCGLPPTGSEPPGLGFSIICSLADKMTLHSDLSGGTSLDATIVSDRHRDDGPRRHPPAPERCELSFGDGAFLRSILARVLAAQVDTSAASVDLLGDAVRAGDAIAESLEAIAAPAPPPPMTVSAVSDPPLVAIAVTVPEGTSTGAMADDLRAALEREVPALSVTVEGEDTALLTLPLGEV